MDRSVRVGVAAVIVRDDTILLGERIGAHGANTWATPGGHLEFGESIEACAEREVLEETGLTAHAEKKLVFTNDIFHQDQKHYVTLFVLLSCEKGDPKVTEPDKCKQWKWCSLTELPHPLFLPLQTLFKEHPQLADLL
ncbi:nucleotide triphosphate diphosphatase NUDT15 [Vibrio hangzhouensis]|uniref:nucleotide triphosphate diphosphatase NUDT15 n=1 Tax=Vibrio hangzhouensis TaxID=462991 RepID=UPI001C93EB03|nr:NUDIX hydrolase [Vibrio hangzhouensis]MBY6196833.1 NUDIX domain-containing protein [Vibrio hangzhouensis]